MAKPELIEKLKSCPFCGESERLRIETTQDGLRRDRYQVRCENCWARGSMAGDPDIAKEVWGRAFSYKRKPTKSELEKILQGD